MSTIPLARRVAATASASIESSKSMVPITSERWAGSATYGVVYDVRSAHPYSASDDAVVRLTIASSPPWPFIHCSCCSIRNSVPTPGVL